MAPSLFGDGFQNSPCYIAVRKMAMDISHHNLRFNQNVYVAPDTTNLMSRPMESRRQRNYLVSLGCYSHPTLRAMVLSNFQLAPLLLYLRFMGNAWYIGGLHDICGGLTSCE